MQGKFSISGKLLALLSCLLGGVALAQQALPVNDGQKHLGVATCANSLCHGAVIPHIDSNIAHTEYTVWARNDPHARTWQKLFREDYVAITRKLGLKPPHQEPVCLACHASNVPVAQRGDKFSLSDGIGCETCHGGSEKYIATHTRSGVTRAQNIANGLYPTDDIVARANLCQSCHYGGNQQFVTHQIMAAGHPRISYEFDTFTALLASHAIYDQDYAARKPIYSNVKMWALGQAVAAQAMVDMLDTKHLSASGLFPELSLFDCHSCHHPMSQQTWLGKGNTGLGPGAIPLNDSALLMLRLVLGEVEPARAASLTVKLRELHSASNSSPWLTKKRAAELRLIVSDAIRRIDDHNFSPRQTLAIANALLSAGIAGEYRDYIAAEQAVMGISALIAAWNEVDPFEADTTALVNRLMQRLYDSVANDESFKPADFEAALAQLKNGLIN